MVNSAFLVITLTIIFVVVLNWVIIRIVRSSVNDAHVLRRAVRSSNKPFAGEEEQLQELSKLVNSLQQDRNNEE